MLWEDVELRQLKIALEIDTNHFVTYTFLSEETGADLVPGLPRPAPLREESRSLLLTSAPTSSCAQRCFRTTDLGDSSGWLLGEHKGLNYQVRLEAERLPGISFTRLLQGHRHSKTLGGAEGGLGRVVSGPE